MYIGFFSQSPGIVSESKVIWLDRPVSYKNVYQSQLKVAHKLVIIHDAHSQLGRQECKHQARLKTSVCGDYAPPMPPLLVSRPIWECSYLYSTKISMSIWIPPSEGTWHVWMSTFSYLTCFSSSFWLPYICKSSMGPSCVSSIFLSVSLERVKLSYDSFHVFNVVHSVHSDNCYINRSNNPQIWPNEWTTLMPPSNDILCFIITQMYNIHPTIHHPVKSS